MQPFFFYLFAALTLACGLCVLLSHNPVTSAMFLVLSIVSLAGLFVLLHAFFLAAVQILVYAGAVIVLFLFVIMLLDLKIEERRRIRAIGALMGLVSVGAVGFAIVTTIVSNPASRPLPPPRLEGATGYLGQILFTRYLLPFEIVSLLLLVAMVGVILLSKKDLR